MTFLEFAEKVLKKTGHPLTPLEIWESPVGIELRKDFTPEGKTPVASLGAQLYTNCKMADSIFRAIGKNPARFVLKQGSDDLFPLEERGNSSFEVDLFSEPSQEGRYSFTECAKRVLEGFANNQPMHYRDITKKALEMGWLTTNGKTPEASMYAQIIAEIQRRKKRGELPRFIQCGDGMISLSGWQKNGLIAQIDSHNKKIADQLKEKLFELTPEQFEKLIEKLLREMGFVEVSVTPLSGDGGIDARGIMVTEGVVRTRMAVQAKRWKNNVQSPVVQQVRGSLGIHEQGLIITTSDFSKGAYEEANKPNKTPIALMNGKQLVSLLMNHCIGVKKQKPLFTGLMRKKAFGVKPFFLNGI